MYDKNRVPDIRNAIADRRMGGVVSGGSNDAFAATGEKESVADFPEGFVVVDVN